MANCSFGQEISITNPCLQRPIAVLVLKLFSPCLEWSTLLVFESGILIPTCSGQQQFVEKPRGPKLLDAVMATLRNDGSILMPVDTAGRVLEVMLLLEKHWAGARLSYPLALLSPVAYNTLEFAKSQLEWMNEQVAKEFENSRDKDNPFSMRCGAVVPVLTCVM